MTQQLVLAFTARGIGRRDAEFPTIGEWRAYNLIWGSTPQRPAQRNRNLFVLAGAMTHGQPDDLADWYDAEHGAEFRGVTPSTTEAKFRVALGLISLGLAAYFALHRRSVS